MEASGTHLRRTVALCLITLSGSRAHSADRVTLDGMAHLLLLASAEARNREQGWNGDDWE